MLKREYDKSGMQQINVNTGHQAFDKQTTAIVPGQVIGGTQRSASVRSRFQVKTPINTFVDKGHLQQLDLRNEPHRSAHTGAKILAKALADKNDVIIFHHFFHHNGEKRIEHGCIISKDTVILAKCYYGNRQKTMTLIDRCAEFIGDCNKDTILRFYGY